MRASLFAACALALLGCSETNGGVPGPAPVANPVQALDSSPPTPRARVILGSSLWKAGHPVASLAATPDGRLLAEGDVTGDVRLFDTRDGTLVRAFRDHGGAVLSLAFSPDAGLLASVGEDHRTVVRRLSDGTVVFEVPGPGSSRSSYAAAAFAPDGRWLAIGSINDGFVVVDSASGSEVARRHLLPSPFACGPTFLAWSLDGSRIVCGGEDGRVVVTESSSGRVLSDRGAGGSTPGAWVLYAAAADADGSLMAVRRDGAVLRGLETGAVPQASVPTFAPPDPPLVAVLPATGNDRLLLASSGGHLRWVDLPSGRVGESFEVSVRRLRAAVLLGTSDRVAVADEEGCLRILDATDGRLLAESSGHIGPVTFIEVDDAGKGLLTVGTDGTGRRWDAETGREEQHPDAGRTLREWQDERSEVSARYGRGSCVLWEMDLTRRRFDFNRLEFVIAGLWKPGSVLEPLESPLPLRPARIPGRGAAPSGPAAGRLFAMGLTDGEILLLRVGGASERAEESVGRTLAHGGAVLALKHITQGDLLLSGGGDGRVRLWHLPDMEPRGSSGTEEAGVTALAVSSDHARVWAGLANGTVLGYDMADLRGGGERK